MLNFTINEELCIQCGLCAQDCMFGVIELDGFPRIKNEERCIKCQHCFAVCPTGALSILGNYSEDSILLKGAFPNESQMEALIKGRRSVRKYKQEGLEVEQINKLVDTAWHAPTGVNSQQVHITLMDDPNAVQAFSDEVFKRLAEGINTGTLPETPISHYLEWAHQMKQDTGEDIIFRGAPHFLLASSPKTAPSPVADTHIFLSYFELMAQSMKIGTLWNGFLKHTIDTIFPDFREELGIPEDHVIGYAMIFGKPAVKYQRTLNRGRARVNRVGWK